MANDPSPKRRPIALKIVCGLGKFLLGLIALIAALYLFGLIYYDGPFGPAASTGNLVLATAWLVLLVAHLLRWKSARSRLIIAASAMAVVLIPWSFKKPSNEREWKPEFGKTGWVDIEGDKLTFHNFRNFDYDAEGNEIPRWETRVHHLSKLQELDYFHDAWGGDLLAHPILSFDFGDEGHVCLSIETRREKSESFSALGGLYKMFELQYIFGSEEDFIRVRTNVRDEPVYLYRMRTKPEMAQEILIESITVHNEMRNKPRCYNVLTANCTTSLRAQTPAERRERFDIRMLLNGLLDEYVHEKGGIVDEGMSFEELRPKAHINEVARSKVSGEDFSERIRTNRPGFRASPSE